MKVNESELREINGSVTESGMCDFCGIWEAKYTINGGLWWLCDHCMTKEFEHYVHPKEEEE